MATPLHELGVIAYLLENSTELKPRLQLLYHLSLLEGKCKFQIYHMYLFLNKLLENKRDASSTKSETEAASKHYQNIILYEKMLHNLIFIKAHYESKLKEETNYNLSEYVVKPEDLNIKLEKAETKHMTWLENKFKELKLFDLKKTTAAEAETTSAAAETTAAATELLASTETKEVHAVEFYYADWCGYCVKFKPTWKEFKAHVRKNKQNILIREINADDPKKADMRKQRNIQGYPSIVIVYKDKSFDFYEDERTLEKMLEKI